MMRVSQRMTDVQSPMIPVIGEMIRATPGAISLGQGVVGYGPPPQAAQRAHAFATAGDHKYKPVQGLAELIEAVSRKHREENGFDAAQRRAVVVTAGGNMAFMNAVLAIADPGDQIILPTPYYFNHEMAVGIAGCRALLVPTDANYQLRPDALAAAITPRTRAIVTISPNNPTGAVYSEASLREVNQICADAGIYHIHVEKRGTGTWTLSNIGNGYTGSTVVTDSTLRVTGSIATSSGVTVNGGTFDAAATQTLNFLSVNGGGTAVVSAGTLKVGVDSAINPLLIGELGSNIARVDLKTNAMIVDYSAGNEQSTLQYVRGKIVSGYNGGTWDGQGITSANAAADHSKAIGYAQASEILPPGGGVFLNQSVDDTAILTRYTLAGDTNLDGSVNFTDLVALAQHYGADLTDPNSPNLTDSWWTHGDFDYDGQVSFTDLVKLAQNYNAALPGEPIPGAPIGFGDDLARAFAAVPEPATLAVVGIAACGFARRRRRKPSRI